MYNSEVKCRKEVDTPWSIYRDFTVAYLFIEKLYDIYFSIHRLKIYSKRLAKQF